MECHYSWIIGNGQKHIPRESAEWKVHRGWDKTALEQIWYHMVDREEGGQRNQS